jgi:hypothetical protein
MKRALENDYDVYDIDYLSDLPTEMADCIAAYLSVVDQLMLSLTNKHHLRMTRIVPCPNLLPDSGLGYLSSDDFYLSEIIDHIVASQEVTIVINKHIWTHAAKAGYLTTKAGPAYLEYLISSWPIKQSITTDVDNQMNLVIYFSVALFGSPAAFWDSQLFSIRERLPYADKLIELATNRALREGNVEMAEFFLTRCRAVWTRTKLLDAIYSKDLNTVLFAVAQESYTNDTATTVKTLGIQRCNDTDSGFSSLHPVKCLLGPLEITRIECDGQTLEHAACFGTIEIFEHLYDFGYRTVRSYFDMLGLTVETGSLAFCKIFCRKVSK